MLNKAFSMFVSYSAGRWIFLERDLNRDYMLDAAEELVKCLMIRLYPTTNKSVSTSGT